MKLNDLAAAVVAADDAVKAAERNLELLKAEFKSRVASRTEKSVWVGNRKVSVEPYSPRDFDLAALVSNVSDDVLELVAPRKVGATKFDAAVSAGLIDAHLIDEVVSRRDAEQRVFVR